MSGFRAEFFHTEAEALAFIQGIELADRDWSVCGPRRQDGREDGQDAWAVGLHIWGCFDEGERCPVCDGYQCTECGEWVTDSDVCESCAITVKPFDSLSSATKPAPLSPGVISRCDNCQSIWDENELCEISKYFERVEAGGTVPSGECPECGALCYLTKPEKIMAQESDDPSDSGSDSGQPKIALASVDQPSLWIDFGSGDVERFDFATAQQQTFFLEGACTVANRLGLDDVRFWETEQEMLDSHDERPKIIVNPPFVKEGDS
jgi:hypothetical protein